jgi:hypothetical protein
MLLEVDINVGQDFPSIRGLGHKLIKTVEIDIGGQKIDKHYGEWLDIWSQLSDPSGKSEQLSRMINGSLGNLESSHDDPVNPVNPVRKLYIPLKFWFNRNPGLALPLIALQYHEVKLIVEINKIENIKWIDVSSDINCACKVNTTNIRHLINTTNDCQPQIEQVCLFCDYIFLDTDERRRFAQVSHEYLIDQLQMTCESVCIQGGQSNINLSLDFNHPVKSLYWVAQRHERQWTYDYTRYGKGNSHPGIETDRDNFRNAKLQLNGSDRFRTREASYFRLVQPYQHIGGAPDQGISDSFLARGCINSDIMLQPVCTKWRNRASPEHGYIHMYSFGLRPLEHQPSGTCNFSRIDNANLLLNLNQCPKSGQSDVDRQDENIDVRVYANNYNVLRIMSGMGGLAYSN